jgi:hypothetical protein
VANKVDIMEFDFPTADEEREEERRQARKRERQRRLREKIQEEEDKEIPWYDFFSKWNASDRRKYEEMKKTIEGRK